MPAFDLARVKDHLARLRDLVPDEPAWWQTGPTWTIERLVAFERVHGELPAGFRSWLVEIGDGGAGFLAPDDGFVSLARFAPDREHVTKPFRMSKAAKRVTYPIGGVLYLGERAGCRAFLVLRGNHGGEVWIDRTAKKDGAFACEGTFEDLTRQWIASSGSRVMEKRAAGDTAVTWEQLCGDLVTSLRAGPEKMIDVFDQIAIAKQRDATNGLALAVGQHVERWLFDPRLAPTAALVLTACLDRVNVPRTRVEAALAAIADHSETLDLAPAKVSELLAACVASTSYEDAHLYWFERELAATGRLDEAIAAFRARAVWQNAEYVELARALIAAGRAADAIAVGAELAAKTTLRDLDWARGWVLVEAGQVEEGKRMLAHHVARDIDPGRQQLVSKLHGSVTPPPSPTDISFVATGHRAIPLHAATAHYELTSLLYAIGQEPESALDAAIRALSFHGVRRHPREHANHQANLRIAQVMLGRADSNETQLTANYLTVAARKLAAHVLGKLPPSGIELVVRQRYP